MKFLSLGNFGFFIGDNDFVVTFEVNLGRIHKKAVSYTHLTLPTKA